MGNLSMKGQLIDVTRPITRDMLEVPGVAPLDFVQRDEGRYLISDFRMSTHLGTHVDAPSHYLRRGESVERIPLEKLVGMCRVLDLRGNKEIDAVLLEDRVGGCSRVLMRTDFSAAAEFNEDFPYLTVKAARLLIEHGVQCIGTDSPSMERLDGTGEVHHLLLGHGCVILEMLNMGGVAEGDYELLALPLPLVGLDGAPARVVLREV
jgi:arylformamidase